MKELFLIKEKQDFNKINLCWVLSILLILLISLFSRYMFDFWLFDLETLFDVEHYLNISKHGYRQYYEFAFFPLLPIIMRFFDIFNMPILLTIILNNILCLFSSYIIYNILTDIYKVNRETSIYGVIFWLVSPVRVFVFVPYTESIFVFLTLMSFYYYKKRKNPFVLGISLGLSVATKSMGSIFFFVIFAFLFIDMIKSNKADRLDKIIYIFRSYVPATIISCIYPIYLHFIVGDWKYFLTAQYDHWYRVNGNLIEILIYDIKRLVETESYIIVITTILTFISLFIALALMIKSFIDTKFEKLDLILIFVFEILVIFSTYKYHEVSAGSTSFFRYLYSLIPMYLLFSNKTSNLSTKILILSHTLLLMMVTFLFLGNNFVA